MKNIKVIIAAIPVLIIVVFIFISMRVMQYQEEVKQSELEAAYNTLLPEYANQIHNRYYDRREVFTDRVERFRFDVSDDSIVDYLVKTYEMTRAKELTKSTFGYPDWWKISDNEDIYRRGKGQQYTQLAYDSIAHRIFFELSVD